MLEIPWEITGERRVVFEGFTKVRLNLCILVKKNNFKIHTLNTGELYIYVMHICSFWLGCLFVRYQTSWQKKP